jgi:hypothetical protein
MLLLMTLGSLVTASILSSGPGILYAIYDPCKDEGKILGDDGQCHDPPFKCDNGDEVEDKDDCPKELYRCDNGDEVEDKDDCPKELYRCDNGDEVEDKDDCPMATAPDAGPPSSGINPPPPPVPPVTPGLEPSLLISIIVVAAIGLAVVLIIKKIGGNHVEIITRGGIGK